MASEDDHHDGILHALTHLNDGFLNSSPGLGIFSIYTLTPDVFVVGGKGNPQEIGLYRLSVFLLGS